ERERFQQVLASGPRPHMSAGLPFCLVPPLELGLINRSADHEGTFALITEAATTDEISVVAIVGPGGFGKTTLAVQLVHDERIRTLFPETLWVEAGQDCTPARVVELVSDLCFHLDGSRPALNDPAQAGFHLARVLGERRVLLVIDNVWSAADLQ